MKNTNQSHSSSLFLLELVIAILIFSITSAVSIRFFAQAHLLNEEAKVLNYFTNECSSIAEIVSVSKNQEELEYCLKDLYPFGIYAGNDFLLSYDHELNFCEGKNARYSLTVSITTEDSMLTANIHAQDLSQHTSLYSLQAIRYIGRGNR